MPSQFFGLNIGASALSAFQTSVNTAANNVANVRGYLSVGKFTPKDIPDRRQICPQPIRSVYIPDTAVSEPVWK